MSEERQMSRSPLMVGFGIGLMLAGTVGIVLLFVWALPQAGRLGSASPACLFDYCVPIIIYRAMAMGSLFAAIGGVGLIVAGRRGKERRTAFGERDKGMTS